MTIGELAGRAGIRPSRIRYYESVGVLPPPRRQSGARRYDVSAVETLRSVLVAQRLGLSLAEIRAVASGERNLADIAMEHARELGATIRRARVRLALLRHAAHTTQLSAERYERVLAKAEVLS
jgi:MerR family redox-sensitive transcriptional activator SoxR